LSRDRPLKLTSSFVLVARTFSVHRPLLSTIFHGFLSALLHLLLQYMNVLSATSAFLWEILSLPIRHSLREIPHLCHESGLFAIAVHYDQLAIFLTLSVIASDISSDIASDISSDILYEKPAPCAKIGLL
jgi:hypothetical protein